MTARSLKPSVVVTSGPESTVLASWALKVASGRRCSALGNTIPQAGSNTMRPWVVIQEKNPLIGMMRWAWVRNDSGEPSRSCGGTGGAGSTPGSKADRSRFGQVTFGEELDEVVQVVPSVGDSRRRVPWLCSHTR